MEWMLLPLKRYAQFSGRARPKEYWMYVLFILICYIVIMAVERMLGLSSGSQWASQEGMSASAGFQSNGGPLSLIFALGTFIPSLAVAIRRLHDTDRSGWWMLLCFLPLIGGIVLLVFMIQSGTRGPNRFGPDPLQDGPSAEIFS